MRRADPSTSIRCERCRLAPRWCVCSVYQDVELPLAVDVLMHHREMYRPTSTGHLIHRLVGASRLHVWRRERRLESKEIQLPGRELWILHPQGDPVEKNAAPDHVQVVLLDGSWRETGAMAHEVRGWGRLVSLPMQGESRFWLRSQSEPGRFSTIEALLFLLRWFGLTGPHESLGAQFELHVYAGLRARGQKELAAQYLLHSTAPTAFPGLLEQLNVRRPREG